MRTLGLVLLVVAASSLVSCSSKKSPPARDAAPESRTDGAREDLPGGDASADGSADASFDGSSDADAGGGTCFGAIEFRLEALDANRWFANAVDQDCNDWLSVYDSAGQEVAIGHPTDHCCQLLSCDSCWPDVICTAAFYTQPLPIAQTWDATIFPLGSCGGEACVGARGCAPAGHYVARMCGFRSDNDPRTCIDVPFDLPGGSTVVGTIFGSGDAGID